MSTTPEMGKWRERLWPVYAHELKKFIPMVVIMFWILFNYTLVRNIKDSILVNAPHSSSHVLPWVKIIVVTPASILFVVLYAKLSNILSRDALYYSCLVPFALFFVLFAAVIYPNHELLNATPETVLAWKQASPKFFQNLFPAIGYWTFTWFYAMAELWGNIGVAVLFWQFANQITPTLEAKRFYPIFGFWSNLGLVAAGLLLKYAEPLLEATHVAKGVKDFTNQIMLFCGFITAGCLIIGFTYWWMGKYVLTDPRYYNEASLVKKGKEKKPKLSIGESIKYLMKSKYLGYIAVLVLAYGIAINIVEISWKESVKDHFTCPLTGKRNAAGYSAFMGDLFIYTGLLTMVLIMFSQNIVRLMGWRFSAVITPWVSLITGGIFFFFLIFKDSTVGMCSLINTTPIGVAIWLGLAQNAITKAAKYALFDPTKEMAYIPLDEESKVKGKAAIDVVGGRAGKAGGSIINLALGSLQATAFFSAIGGVLLFISLWWVWAVEKLSKAYHQKVEEKEGKKVSQEV